MHSGEAQFQVMDGLHASQCVDVEGNSLAPVGLSETARCGDSCWVFLRRRRFRCSAACERSHDPRPLGGIS